MKDKTRKLIYGIMAVLVSIGAWAFVVYNYDPYTHVKYNDVSLDYVGERALADRGLAVSEAGEEDISVTLEQKRVDVNKISSSDITAELDVSACVAGDNKVSPNVSGPKETAVVTFDAKPVNVQVERTESKFLDIDVIYSGDAPEDAAPIVSYIANDQAEAVCAVSNAGNIKRIVAVLDYNEVGNKTKSYTAKLVALDKEGNEVPHSVIYPEEVSLDAASGKIKTVNLAVSVKNDSDEQYERKYVVPEKVTIVGPEDEVSKIEIVNAEEIDVNYYYEDSEIPIECDLPEGVQIAGNKELVLKLSVKKKASKTNSEDQE